MRTITVNGKQLGKEDIYLDLDKLSEEQKDRVIKLVRNSGDMLYDYLRPHGRYLAKNFLNEWVIGGFVHRTEITYSQFLELIGEPEQKTKYRFKTLDEFDKEFNKNERGSYKAGKAHFVDGMYHLAGLPTPDKFSEQIIENPDGVMLNLENIVEGKDNNWYFTPEMLTLNEHGEDAQRSKENLEKLNKLVIEGAKHTLESNGYFVFPKAPEGDFPDLSGFKGAEMEASDSGTIWFKQNVRCKDYSSNQVWFITEECTYKKVRPIQPEITPEEIVEKLGKDYLLNLIKEKENGKDT